MLLIGLGEAIAIVVGLWLGRQVGLAARRRRSTGSATALSLVFYSMPYFVIGMPLIIVFAVGPGLVPDLGHDHARRRQDARSSTCSTSGATSSCR